MARSPTWTPSLAIAARLRLARRRGRLPGARGRVPVRADGWRRAGSFGMAGAFSFYPGKNLGACGEAGAITTNDEGVASTIRMLRDHGQAQKYYHEIEGYNGRLDAIQAAFLRIKLRRLDEWNTQRRRPAARYDRLLAGVPGIVMPCAASASRPVYHLYVVRTEDRDGLAGHLAANGIQTGLHYPRAGASAALLSRLGLPPRRPASHRACGARSSLAADVPRA